MLRTKQAIIDELYALLGSPAPQVSTGSTEPKQVFTDTILKLALPISHALSKPELGKAIATAAGILWTSDCDSTASPSGGGSTVTAVGLQRVLQSAQVLLGRPPTVANGTTVQTGTPYSSPPAPHPRTEPALRLVDPDVLARATRAHHTLQDSIAALVRTHGLQPMSPRPWDPQFDIAWRSKQGLVVCEVKTGCEESREQVRLGMGQVVEYRQVLHDRGETPVLAALAMDSRADALTRRVAQSLAIVLIQEGALAPAVASLS